MRTKILTSILALALVATLSSPAFAAKVKIVNGDAPGEGFNDPTPAAPVGGNKGNTVGEQRRIAFQFAADIWGASLPANEDVQIRVFSRFDPLSCTAGSAVLGSAGAITVFSDFPGATFPATWYGSALANKLAGFDLFPGPKVVPGAAPGSFTQRMFDDINARFNSSLGGTNPDGSPCFTGGGWYYGLDTNTPPNLINLVAVLLHEFGHGLGFQSFVNSSTGAELLGMDDIYERNLQDNDTGLIWNVMTNMQRAASAINTRDVAWIGPNVTAAVPVVLAAGTPLMTVNAPGAIAGTYDVGTAAFGPALSSPGTTGNVVQALDLPLPGSPTPFDGCSPLINAPAILGNIALIDRGTCGFTLKVKNAQNAGAIAAIIADNAAGSPPPGLGGADPTITIPSVRITLADGNLLKANLGGLNVTLGVNLAVRAGADPAGRALIYTPNPVQPGSSVSHWDTIATPNQLMEPFINSNLTHSVQPPQDLTLELLRDIGW